MRDKVRKISSRPTQNTLKITHHGKSPGVERALTDFGAEESFARASIRFKEHYGVELGRTTVLRIVEKHAEEAETYVAHRLEEAALAYDDPIATRPGAETILVELDGCEIRTGKLEAANTEEKTKVRGLPKRKRAEAWRDVRLGLAHPLDSIDRTYVGGMRSYEAVGEQLFSAAVDRGLSENSTVVAVSDGGNGLREQLESQFTNFQFILDRPHFKQHLYETADAMALEGGIREAWVRRVTDACENGSVQDVIAELRESEGLGKDRRRRLSNYLTRFSDAVCYEAFRAAGYPTGSGEIESAHRYIPQKRLKIPGACWHPDTINPMLALRVMRENGWWEDYWNQKAAA